MFREKEVEIIFVSWRLYCACVSRISVKAILLAFKVYGKKKFEIQSIYQYITFNFFGF